MGIRNEQGFLSTKLLIIISAVVLLLIGAGIFIYLKFLSSPKNAAAQPRSAPPQEESLPQQPAAADIQGPIFDLNTFIVNLMGDSGRRYLKVTIKLELSSELLKEEISKKMPEIQDNMLVLLSSKSYDDIADVSGKIRLRAEIMNRINAVLTSGQVRKVYFTEFVIQ
ncbi:MAG: flagellar basal body-associated FliL family protein [bacterium]|nr:flagellar basal body-associated FliL family protein [bacterium]